MLNDLILLIHTSNVVKVKLMAIFLKVHSSSVAHYSKDTTSKVITLERKDGFATLV